MWEDLSFDFMEFLLCCIVDKYLFVCVFESFLELDVDILCLIFLNDRLIIYFEMDVFCVGMKWVNYCLE